RPAFLVTGVGALAVVAVAAWGYRVGIGDRFGIGAPAGPVEVASLAVPARLAGRTSVAVLPFKNLAEDASQDYFSDGITEDDTSGRTLMTVTPRISSLCRRILRGASSAPPR